MIANFSGVAVSFGRPATPAQMTNAVSNMMNGNGRNASRARNAVVSTLNSRAPINIPSATKAIQEVSGKTWYGGQKKPNVPDLFRWNRSLSAENAAYICSLIISEPNDPTGVLCGQKYVAMQVEVARFTRTAVHAVHFAEVEAEQAMEEKAASQQNKGVQIKRSQARVQKKANLLGKQMEVNQGKIELNYKKSLASLNRQTKALEGSQYLNMLKVPQLMGAATGVVNLAAKETVGTVQNIAPNVGKTIAYTFTGLGSGMIEGSIGYGAMAGIGGLLVAYMVGPAIASKFMATAATARVVAENPETPATNRTRIYNTLSGIVIKLFGAASGMVSLMKRGGSEQVNTNPQMVASVTSDIANLERVVEANAPPAMQGTTGQIVQNVQMGVTQRAAEAARSRATRVALMRASREAQRVTASAEQEGASAAEGLMGNNATIAAREERFRTGR